jgi:hypothetical protein
VQPKSRKTYRKSKITRQRMSVAHLGKRHSPETIEKIRAAAIAHNARQKARE